MKKRILSLIIALVLAMVLVVPASATPPTPVQGDLIPLGPHHGLLTGNFSGIYTRVDLNGSVALVLFEGTVNGAAGTLILNHPDATPNGEFYLGQWTILEGTGDLSNLHGQGTVLLTSPTTARYEGEVHFDP